MLSTWNQALMCSLKPKFPPKADVGCAGGDTKPVGQVLARVISRNNLTRAAGLGREAGCCGSSRAEVVHEGQQRAIDTELGVLRGCRQRKCEPDEGQKESGRVSWHLLESTLALVSGYLILMEIGAQESTKTKGGDLETAGPESAPASATHALAIAADPRRRYWATQFGHGDRPDGSCGRLASRGGGVDAVTRVFGCVRSRSDADPASSTWATSDRRTLLSSSVATDRGTF